MMRTTPPGVTRSLLTCPAATEPSTSSTTGDSSVAPRTLAACTA